VALVKSASTLQPIPLVLTVAVDVDSETNLAPIVLISQIMFINNKMKLVARFKGKLNVIYDGINRQITK